MKTRENLDCPEQLLTLLTFGLLSLCAGCGSTSTPREHVDTPRVARPDEGGRKRIEFQIGAQHIEANILPDQTYYTRIGDETARGRIVAHDSVGVPFTGADGKEYKAFQIYYRTGAGDTYVGPAEELQALLLPQGEEARRLSKAETPSFPGQPSLPKESQERPVAAVIKPLGDRFRATAGREGMHILMPLITGRKFDLGAGLLVDILVYKRQVNFLPGILRIKEWQEIDRLRVLEPKMTTFVFSEGAYISVGHEPGEIILEGIERRP